MSEIEEKVFEGGCLCGAVRYEYKYSKDTQPMFNSFCHCKSCRTLNNASGIHIMGVPTEAFTFTKGEETLVQYDITPKMYKKFCPVCGVSLLQAPVGYPFYGTFPTNYDVCAQQFPKNDAPDIFTKPAIHTNMENSFCPHVYVNESIPRFKDLPASFGGSNLVYVDTDCTETKEAEG